MRLTLAFALLSTILFAVPAIAWDPVRDLTSKRIKDHAKQWEKDIKNAPRSVGRCVGDPAECIERQIERIPYAALMPVIEHYKAHLFGQGAARAQPLPPALIAFAQPHYEVDLRAVRYATHVNTLHRQAITWENFIFFPDGWDIGNDADLRLMLHELEHVVQYRRRGGYREFVGEYFLKSAGKIIQRGSFNVHDSVDIERAADAKANRLLAEARNYLAQSTSFAAVPGPRNGPPMQPVPPRPFYFSQQAYHPMVSRCVTQAGACALNRPQPPESPCGCYGPYGPIPGIAR